MKIGVSEIVTALDDQTIGTKIVNKEAFMTSLAKAIAGFEFPADRQGFVPLPEATTFVSCGVARRPELTLEDYIVREYRGTTALFARRGKAAPAESLAAIVYTRDAYLADPEVDEAEAERIGDAEFVLVAILASVGPKPPVGSHRFVRNLAGANRAYSPEQGYTLDKAIEEAKAIVKYENDWITVAD